MASAGAPPDAGVRCPGGTPICDTGSRACVGCQTSSDCAPDGGNFTPGRPVCDSTTFQCVQCQVDNNCTGATPRCDTANNTCVECLAHADCATSTAGPVCRPATHTCGPGCLSDTQCADGGTNLHCNMANFTCVQCVDNSNCSGLTPVCDTAALGMNNHRCVVCLPAPMGSDAGPQGCDAGQTSCVARMGGFVCQ
jgi:hypothetical protein